MNKKVIDILYTILPDTDIENSEDLFDDGLDSMGVMALIEAIQSNFSIEIATEDITAVNFINVSCITSLLDKYGIS